ncbi:hypothetical protein NU195Hw_g1332t1 [Hortaea werneckii]
MTSRPDVNVLDSAFGAQNMSLSPRSPPRESQSHHGSDGASSVTSSVHSGSTGHKRPNSSTGGSQTSVSSSDDHPENQQRRGRANDADSSDTLGPQLNLFHGTGKSYVATDKTHGGNVYTADARSADGNERRVEDNEDVFPAKAKAHMSSNSSNPVSVEDSGLQDEHFASDPVWQPSVADEPMPNGWHSSIPGDLIANASLQSLPKDLRMDICGWQALQNRATRQPVATLSSVGFQVRKLLQQKERQGTSYKIKAGHKCPLCSQPIGDTREAIFVHARAHWTCPTQPKYECWVCGVDFAFERDYRHHRQHHRQDQFLSECEELFATNDDSWLRRALLQKFESDLRLWEKFQLLQYLDIVDAYLGRTLSERALRKGRMTEFRDIISKRNRHICGICERFALCTAAMNGDVEALSALLDAGMSPNVAGPEVLPFRPLDLAMCRGRIKVAEILLEKGAIIKRTKRYHATFWMLAAQENIISLAKGILKAGLDSDFQLDNEPLLLHALRHGSSASVILLLNYCSDVNTKGKDGKTALHLACTKSSTVPVKLLLESGADVETAATSLDTHGMTPLMFAVANRRLDVVKLLLTHKANVNSLDVLGRTALHHACDHTEKHPWLDAQIARALLAAGAEVDRQDVSGQTALMYAARTGTLNFVSDLLEVGAEIGIKAHSGLDAQGMARISGNVMLEKLLEDAAKERRGWV